MLDKSSHDLIFQLREMLGIDLMHILIDNVKEEDLQLLENLVNKQKEIGEKSR